jgi:hypothetical protein
MLSSCGRENRPYYSYEPHVLLGRNWGFADSEGSATPILIKCFGLLFCLVIKSIREFNHAAPFVPYAIQMAWGETYTVPHPDFISISPRGSSVIIIDAEERPHHLNALLIDRASPLNGHKARKSRRRTQK